MKPSLVGALGPETGPVPEQPVPYPARSPRMGVFALAVSVLVAAPTARAQEATPELRYDLRIDLPVTAVSLALQGLSGLFANELAADSCRWCDRDADGSDDLNSVDAAARDALLWSDVGAARSASDVTSYLLAPGSALGLLALAAAREDRIEDFPVDALVVAEATLLAANLHQVTRYLVARERPLAHFASPEERDRLSPAARNTSFYSGHAAVAFALAVSAGTVASMREYPFAPWIWASGLTIATASSFLRVAGDKHYLTDVLVGVVVSSAVGWVIPYLFHRPDGVSEDVTESSLVRPGRVY